MLVSCKVRSISTYLGSWLRELFYEHAEELASDNPVLRLVCSWVDKLILEWRNPRMNRLGVFLGGSLFLTIKIDSNFRGSDEDTSFRVPDSINFSIGRTFFCAVFYTERPSASRVCCWLLGKRILRAENSPAAARCS